MKSTRSAGPTLVAMFAVVVIGPALVACAPAPQAGAPSSASPVEVVDRGTEGEAVDPLVADGARPVESSAGSSAMTTTTTTAAPATTTTSAPATTTTIAPTTTAPSPSPGVEAQPPPGAATDPVNRAQVPPVLEADQRIAPLAAASAQVMSPDRSSSLLAQAAGQVVLDDGHTDLIEVTVDAGRLVVSVKDDTSPGGAVFRAPTDVQARVKDGAKILVPDDPAFSFLGAAGSELWMLPQVQDPALLWPGWSTERLAPGQLRGDAVTLRLAAADGPGSFALFTTSQFGSPSVIFDSDGGAANSTVIPINTHAHSSWAFGAEGVYRLTFEVSAMLADGTPVSTPVTYIVLVGDATAPVPWDQTEAPAVTPPAGGSGVSPPGTAFMPSGNAAPGSPAGSAPGRTGAIRAGIATGSSGSLASTGSTVAPLLLVALALLASGTALERSSRRVRR